MNKKNQKNFTRCIETTRLTLRPSIQEDLPELFAFLGDAEAMRHTHVDASLRACRRRILVHEWRRRRDGVAPWTIIRRTDEKIIGWGGLYDDPFDPGWGIEVGYFFHPAAWGQGYASELLAACLTYELPEIKAFAKPENLASRRVLEKAGFTFLREVPEMNRLLYHRRSPS